MLVCSNDLVVLAVRDEDSERFGCYRRRCGGRGLLNRWWLWFGIGIRWLAGILNVLTLPRWSTRTGFDVRRKYVKLHIDPRWLPAASDRQLAEPGRFEQIHETDRVLAERVVVRVADDTTMMLVPVNSHIDRCQRAHLLMVSPFPSTDLYAGMLSMISRKISCSFFSSRASANHGR